MPRSTRHSPHPLALWPLRWLDGGHGGRGAARAGEYPLANPWPKYSGSTLLSRSTGRAAACALWMAMAASPAQSLEVITLNQDDLAFNRCVAANGTVYLPRDWAAVIPDWNDLNDNEREYRKAAYMQQEEDAARKRAEELCRGPK